jgi:hypothetical protein
VRPVCGVALRAGVARILRALLLGLRVFILGTLAASAGEPKPPPQALDLVRIVDAQPQLLKAQAAKLAPHRKGETDIYAIGIAGWPMDVFLKEVDGGLAAIGATLPIKNRTFRLINHPATVASVPLATVPNFADAVHAVGSVMDKKGDVLVLLMTSHGDRNGFGLRVPSATIDLTPAVVATTLDREGIKNRVVIVSACFSGIFVPPLQNDSTIVMTAADASHTSFGCAPENDWTYFGDAFFRQALAPGIDFQNAFDHARVLIQGWEEMDHAPPSNPQGSFGPALVAKLAPFFGRARASAEQ